MRDGIGVLLRYCYRVHTCDNARLLLAAKSYRCHVTSRHLYREERKREKENEQNFFVYRY